MQTTGLNRNVLDKFYTKHEIVELCLNHFINIINPDDEVLIIEPSAGNGSFIDGIKMITSNYLFYDILPEHNEVIKQDYLEYEPDTTQPIHIVGNPPFGRQSSMAIKFIKKSCMFCDSISFILPKSFKKDSLKKHFPLNYHLIFEIDLPSNSFLLNDKEYDVPCIFQIWKKKETLRMTNPILIPNQFRFVNKNEHPDISFRRVGVNSGFMDTDTNKNIQSHYFIKFTNENSIKKNMELLSAIHFTFNNTVGPKSISKQELIYEFNKILK